MIVASTAAFVSWDLILFSRDKLSDGLSEAKIALERQHLKSLGLAISIGLMLALVSSTFDFQLAFGAVVLLVLIAFGGLVFGMQYVTKKKL